MPGPPDTTRGTALDPERASDVALGAADRARRGDWCPEDPWAGGTPAIAETLAVAETLAIAETLAQSAPAASPEERLLIAHIAHGAARDGSRPSAEVSALALRALAGLTPPSDDASRAVFALACTALCCSEGFAALDQALDAVLDAPVGGAESGAARMLAGARFDRAQSRLRQGRLLEAIADLDALEPLARAVGPDVVLRSSGLRALCLLERDRAEAARAVLAAGSVGVEESEPPCCLWMLARARATAATGDLEGALDDLTRCGELQLRRAAPNPAHLWWRSDASEVALRLGHREQALALALEELELARLFGSPRAVGIALIAAGAARGGDRGRELLVEAVSVLRASAAKLELARALFELGALVRRAGERRNAREALREGCDLAERIGATRLAARAREELKASGARLRRDRLGGPSALTPSERRTADLAAAGMTNREIAAQLFVTIRTVTTHLTHAYQKLGVSGRGDLAAALAAPTGPVPGGPDAEEGATAMAPLHPASAAESPASGRATEGDFAARWAALSGAALALARAIAVLGREHAARCAGPLSRLEQVDVERAIAELTRAGIVDEHELWFSDAADAASVYARIPPRERSRAHGHAARLLGIHRAHDDEIAGHLLRSEPAGDDGVIVLLRAAAGRALAAGAPERAVAYLRRAVDEPPDSAGLAAVMSELGTAAAVAGDPAATDDLERALSLEPDPERRARVAAGLAAALYDAGRLDAAHAVAGSAIAELGGVADPELVAALESTRACVELIDGRLAGALAARVPRLRALGIAADSGGQALVILDGFWRWQHRVGGENPRTLVERALELGGFPDAGGATGPVLAFSIAMFAVADDPEPAGRLLERTLRFAQRSGLVSAEVLALGWGAHLALRTGDVAGAERAARAAVEITRGRGLGAFAPFVRSVHAEALAERGRLADAVEAIEPAARGGLEGTAVTAYALFTRGRLSLLRGRHAEAARDLRSCGAASRDLFTDNPEVCPWRSTLALAVAGTDRDEALELARRELALAQRRRHRRAVAAARRACGLVEGGEDGIELLERAAADFASTDARLEHARTLTDLGVALRDRGRMAEGRERLREGLEMAVRAGAIALANRAVRELADAASETAVSAQRS